MTANVCAVLHIMTNMAIVLLAFAALELERQRIAALELVGAWRAHHIRTLREQHEWFREKWRTVHGLPPHWVMVSAVSGTASPETTAPPSVEP